MSDPTIAKRGPYPITVTKGEQYFWCACGKSQTQPFCDGSHKGSSFTPVKFNAEETEVLYFCGCKHTKDQPLCDSSHHQLGGC